MAANLSLSKRKDDFVEEFLTCAICAEPYDDDEHKAKFLPCLHTYCKTCLQQYAGKRQQFNCPSCRNETKVPGETTESLPGNFIVESLMSYQDVFNALASCGKCNDGESGAVSFCHRCGCFLCQNCFENHHKMHSVDDHELSTMQELKETKSNQLTHEETKCKKHPDQVTYIGLNTLC